MRINLRSAQKPSRMELRHRFSTSQITVDEFNSAMRQNYKENPPIKFTAIQLLITGIILILAGVICITAFNWVFLSPSLRFALLEAALAIVFILSFFIKNKLAKQLLYAAFAVLVGCFWAGFGQIYQINTAVYSFPLVWLICLLPFAFIARSAFVWLLSALLLLSYASLYLSSELPLKGMHLFTSPELTVFMLLSAVLCAIWRIAGENLKDEFPFTAEIVLLFIFLISLDIFAFAGFADYALRSRISNILTTYITTMFITAAFTALYSYLPKTAGRLLIYINGVFITFLFLVFILAQFFNEIEVFFAVSFLVLLISFPAYKLYNIVLKLSFQNSKGEEHE